MTIDYYECFGVLMERSFHQRLNVCGLIIIAFNSNDHFLQRSLCVLCIINGLLVDEIVRWNLQIVSLVSFWNLLLSDESLVPFSDVLLSGDICSGMWAVDMSESCFL